MMRSRCQPHVLFVQGRGSVTDQAHRVDPDGEHFVMWDDGSPRYFVQIVCGRQLINPVVTDAETAVDFCDMCLIGDFGQTVYSYADAAGTSLYVGSTNNLLKRTYQHSMSSRWWSEVTDVSFEYVPAFGADVREAAAIRRLNPKYNRQRPRSVA